MGATWQGCSEMEHDRAPTAVPGTQKVLESGDNQWRVALVSLRLQAIKIHIFKYFLKGPYFLPFQSLGLFR